MQYMLFERLSKTTSEIICYAMLLCYAKKNDRFICARPHVSAFTHQFFENLGLRLLPQPAYSPDTSLCDRYIFRHYETFRRDKVFSNENEVKESIQNFKNSMTSIKLKFEVGKLIGPLP